MCVQQSKLRGIVPLHESTIALQPQQYALSSSLHACFSSLLADQVGLTEIATTAVTVVVSPLLLQAYAG